MKKILLLVASILLLASFIFFYRFLPKEITGLFPSSNSTVNINEYVKGQITALIYEEIINLTQIQNITTEFKNIGSTTVTGKIEIRIYWNNQSKLEEMAYYYDSQVSLKPGNVRSFTVSFLPPYLGVFYIKVRVPYDTKAVERWGAFIVTYTAPEIPVQIIYPSQGAEAPAIVEKIRAPNMALEYPEKVKIKQGESKLFNILVKSTGNIPLSNIKLYISTTSLIGIDMNPKVVFKLAPNESSIFLISVNTSKETPLGKYLFDFEVITDEIRESKSIELEVVSELPSIVEDINETILNYEYIISEVQHEIDTTLLKGINVDLPQDTLNKAKDILESAKEYYRQEKYEDVRSKLAEVKKLLEDAVYQLAVASIIITKLPKFIPTYIIPVIIIIFVFLGLILFIIFKRRKKEEEKEKRPKLLMNVSETET